MDLVRAQDLPQMGLVPDEGAVQEFAAASPDPAFGNRVHAGRPYVAQHGPDPGIGGDRVGRGREVRATVADHEFDAPCLVAEVRDQVAGLLAGPVPAGCSVTPRMRMRRVARSITVKTWAWVPSGRSTLKKSQARIAPACERRNCAQAGPVLRGAGLMPLALRISHTVDAATLTPRPASSPWILRYPHPGSPGLAGGPGP